MVPYRGLASLKRASTRRRRHQKGLPWLPGPPLPERGPGCWEEQARLLQLADQVLELAPSRTRSEGQGPGEGSEEGSEEGSRQGSEEEEPEEGSEEQEPEEQEPEEGSEEEELEEGSEEREGQDGGGSPGSARTTPGSRLWLSGESHSRTP